jgi:CubicO group peptidase (beta-lactamase class C family)
MERAGVPGLTAAVVDSDGLLWSGAFGVEAGTVFEAASLTKPVVAHVALQLVEAGKLDLDRPLAAYLGKGVEPEVEGDARYGKITARRVLSHTTGFPNWRRQDPLRIDFEPGEKFSYSGEGFVLLAKVLEKVTGQPLEALVQARLFQPLQMSASSLVWRESYDHGATVGHDEFGEERDKFKPEAPNAAASLHTTAEDYARFLGEILQPALLKPATVEAMLTPQVAIEGPSHARGAAAEARDAAPPALLHWGLGWGLEGTAAPYTFWHWGDNGWFRCLTAGIRGHGQDTGRAFVYFTNSWNGLALAERLTPLLLADGEPHPLTGWIGYEALDSPAFRVRRELLRAGLKGPAALRKQARALRRELGDDALEERTLNNLGYTLLGREETKAQGAALAVFQLNVDLYPESWNVYDSLAEGFMETGDTERAIHFYRQSLRRNPENTHGREMLEKLQGSPPEADASSPQGGMR